jgi:hypothetical protein
MPTYMYVRACLGLAGLPKGASNMEVQALREFTIETRDANDMPTTVTTAQVCVQKIQCFFVLFLSRM